MKKKTDKIIKRKPKQKQKQKQRQKQSQNVIVNVTHPKSKSQSEERSFIPMMPSFNSPAPIIQQSPLSDLAKILNFVSPQQQTQSNLSSRMPYSLPYLPERNDNLPERNLPERYLPERNDNFGGFYNRNDNESFLGEAMNNTINSTRPVGEVFKQTRPVGESGIEDINFFDEEVEPDEVIPIERTTMSTSKISTPRKPYTPMQEPTIAELRRDYLERFGEIVPKKTQKNKIKNALIANKKLEKSNQI
jgi:hypothetical protein